MRKKHGYEALLNYMRMLEEGYSIRFIRREYGINETRLKRLWILYQKYGSSVLHRKSYTQTDGKLRQEIVFSLNSSNCFCFSSSECQKLFNKEINSDGFFTHSATAFNLSSLRSLEKPFLICVIFLIICIYFKSLLLFLQR